MPAPNGGLSVTVGDERLDAYTLSLGRAGVAVRRLELVVSPLEATFFALTNEEGEEGVPNRGLEQSAMAAR